MRFGWVKRSEVPEKHLHCVKCFHTVRQLGEDSEEYERPHKVSKMIIEMKNLKNNPCKVVY